jgi:hypothetical protein
MSLALDVDDRSLSRPADPVSPCAIREARVSPVVTSTEDLVAMCRDLGVGTGLLRNLDYLGATALRVIEQDRGSATAARSSADVGPACRQAGRQAVAPKESGLTVH